MSEIREECDETDLWPGYGQEKSSELLHVSGATDRSAPLHGGLPQWFGGMQRRICFAGDRILAD